MHLERITNYARPHYDQKIEVLGIDDIYQYNQAELIEEFIACEKLKFILDE